MPRNSRIEMVGKLEGRATEALADETRELERELRTAWRSRLATTGDEAADEPKHFEDD